MRYVYLTLAVLLAGVALVFSVQNFSLVTLSFFTLELTVPLWAVVVAAYLAGALTGGFIIGSVRRIVSGSRARRVPA